MTRFFLVLFLAAGAMGASAANWPWQKTPNSPPDYCMGFVVGGLESRKVAGVSRTKLWEAWSYLIRSGALSGISSPGFKTGQELFGDSLDVATIQSNLDEADGSCGLGRSGRQITGW